MEATSLVLPLHLSEWSQNVKNHIAPLLATSHSPSSIFKKLFIDSVICLLLGSNPILSVITILLGTIKAVKTKCHLNDLPI